MDDQIHIKLEWEDAIRRATVPRTETLSGLKRTVNTLLGLEACDLTYTDEEGDLITVGSDLELRQLLDSAAAEKRTLRIKVKSTSKTHASTPAEQVDPEPEEPKYPFAELAKALSEAETVERIQATFQSPVITEAINRFARAYTETGGDVAMSGLVASQSLPALMGLLAGLVQELPILADLQDLLVQQFIARGPPPFAQCIPPAAAAAFGRPPFGPGCGAGPGGMGQGHFGVFCDGCTSDAALKQVAQRDGHMTHRGFIRGTRFKSESVHDFDLCESCMKNTARFPESAYGPFTAVAPPADGQRGPKRCWGWQRRHGGCGPDHHSWRHHGHHRGPHHPDHHHREHPHPDHHHHEHPHPDHHHEHHHPGHHHHHEHAPKDEDQRGVAQGEAVPPAKVWEDIMSSASVGEAIRKGSEAFFGNQTNKNELNDIVQAIAESLKEVQLKATEAQVDSPGAETKVVPPTAPEDPFVKWAQQLRQLQTLGFDRLETYIELLEEEKGDLERVVNRIVRRDM